MNSGVSLDHWTPVAFRSGDVRALQWADLRGRPFDKPFFRATLEAAPDPSEVFTGLDALLAKDVVPALNPSLIIAHPSRSGSTLLARLAAAATADGILVSEPQLLLQLLLANLVNSFDHPIEDVLRCAVRAMGRVRFGTERHYVLKLNSRTARFLPIFRRAFPGVPIIWIQRRPAEIVESNLRLPSRVHAGGDAGSTEEKIIRDVALTFLAAVGFVDDSLTVLDYRELPEAAWTRVAKLMDIHPNSGDLARMRAITQTHSHHGKPFVPRPVEPLSPVLSAIVEQTLNPLYEALARRGQA